MKGKCKLPSALNVEGKLILVDDAISGEVYHCPACNEAVCARKGDKNVYHFAHKRGANCEYGYQTIIHHMAKEIIAKNHKILIPKENINDKIHLKAVDEVKIEKKFGAVIPDILVICDGKPYIVEIYVTHPVDDEKRENVRSLDVSAIEINLSDLRQMIDEKLLEKELYNPERSEFIYNADSARIERKRNFILTFGKKKQIFNEEINCPIVVNRAITRQTCNSCIFSCEDIEKGYIRCGFCVTQDIISEKYFTLVSRKKVMGIQESVQYWSMFKKDLEKSTETVLMARAMRRFRPKRRMLS